MKKLEPSDIFEEEWQRLYDSGESLRDIGSRYNRAPHTIRKYITVTRSPAEANKLGHKRFPNRKHTQETKDFLSEMMKERHRLGLAWTLGHNKRNSEPSWPEQWFMGIINREFDDRNYEFELPFHRYSLDFAWDHKKKVIEIDGEQHQRFTEQIESDKRKDQLLKENGWLILRIPWKDCFNSPQLWIEQAKKFIDG